MVVRFENGVHGTLRVSQTARMGDQLGEFKIDLFGDQGSLWSSVRLKDGSFTGVRIGEAAIHDITIPEEIWGQSDATLSPFMRILSRNEHENIGIRLFINTILGESARKTLFMMDGESSRCLMLP